MTAGTERARVAGNALPKAIDVLLIDGNTARVRPIEPTDADRLVRFHKALSPESVQSFFGAHPNLTPDDVERFTVVDGYERLTLIALVGGQLVGIARYDRLSERSDAEVAVVVADAFRGKGIGTVLIERLADRARRNGIKRFITEVPLGNTKMLDVFRDAGFGGSSELKDGVVRVRFALVRDRCERRVAAAHRRRHRRH